MTDPGKLYNIRCKSSGRWRARRKNGQLFLKLWRPGASEYYGGPILDQALLDCLDYEAIPVDQRVPDILGGTDWKEANK